MNPASLAYIKLGLDALIKLWAIHANKPPGWEPSAADWAELRAQVMADTPEAMREEARKLLAGRLTATPE